MKRILNFLTDRIHELPVLVMMPHSSCNCRCVMCDIWKANSEKRELTIAEIEGHLPAFEKLKIREIVLSGGEALMHKNLWVLCALLKRDKNVRVTLLSTGLLLGKFSKEIVQHIDEVIVSLDGSRDIHNKIRNVPEAFEKLADGVKAIKELKKDFRVTGRCVLQRQNYRDFYGVIESAKKIGLDQISFLPADVTTAAFNHLSSVAANDIELMPEEAEEFKQLIDEFVEDRFVVESPAKLRRISRYYLALVDKDTFESPPCNAPWVSAVLESDGRLMPCFFHKEYGNVRGNDFESVINSRRAVNFRKQLDVKKNEVCKKCVCSLKLPMI